MKIDQRWIVAEALAQSERLLNEMPSFRPLITVREQLEYIDALVSGLSTDPAALERVDISLYAVREFEDRSPQFAEKLYAVAALVQQLKVGLGTAKPGAPLDVPAATRPGRE